MLLVALTANRAKPPWPRDGSKFSTVSASGEEPGPAWIDEIHAVLFCRTVSLRLNLQMPETPLPQPDAFHAKAAVGWLELGNAKEARREFEAIAQVHRGHPDVLEASWPILVEERDWKAALAAAEKLVAVAPDRETGWIQQSFALHELKRTAEAYERLVRVLEKFRGAYVIPYNLACYQCQLGNNEAALKWLRQAVNVSDARTIRAMALKDPDLAPLRDELSRLV